MAQDRKDSALICIGMILAFAGSGCKAPQMGGTEEFVARVRTEWDALLVVLTGGRSPLAKGAPSASPSDDPERTERNAQLIQEMFKVVYRRDFVSPADFGDYVDTLNQGASLEGLYNGFARSSRYRDLENEAGPAKGRSVRIFAEELERIEATLPVRTAFVAADASPLPFPVAPGMPEETVEGSGTMDFGKVPVGRASISPTASPAPGSDASMHDGARVEEYARKFAGASIFTLKRVLGEEALKLIAAKKEDPQALVSWYGSWVAEVASRRVNFGLELRNRPDAVFHENWAKGSTVDRLSWEVLNRLHRILNEAERPQEGNP